MEKKKKTSRKISFSEVYDEGSKSRGVGLRTSLFGLVIWGVGGFLCFMYPEACGGYLGLIVFFLPFLLLGLRMFIYAVVRKARGK